MFAEHEFELVSCCFDVAISLLVFTEAELNTNTVAKIAGSKQLCVEADCRY